MPFLTESGATTPQERRSLRHEAAARRRAHEARFWMGWMILAVAFLGLAVEEAVSRHASALDLVILLVAAVGFESTGVVYERVRG